MHIECPNPFLLDEDVLYHLGLNNQMDLKGMFGDVRYVFLHGSADRAHDFVVRLAKEFQYKEVEGPIGKTERYSLYKVGPFISCSHGMGMPSLSILMNELAKLLYYAEALDNAVFIRLGTCGGVGVEPGTAVITTSAVNGELEPYYCLPVCGVMKKYPSVADQDLVDRLVAAGESIHIPYSTGVTLSADDFYEGQARCDGFYCDYTPEDKFAFLKKAQEANVKNIEMEALMLLAFCNRSHIKATAVCSVIVNREHGDNVKSTPSEIAQFVENTWLLIFEFIRQCEGMK